MNICIFRSFFTSMLAMNLTISVHASMSVFSRRISYKDVLSVNHFLSATEVTPELRNVMKGNFYEMFLKKIGRKQQHSRKHGSPIFKKASREVKRDTAIKHDIFKCAPNQDHVGVLGIYFPSLDHVDGLIGLDSGYPML